MSFEVGDRVFRVRNKSLTKIAAKGGPTIGEKGIVIKIEEQHPCNVLVLFDNPIKNLPSRQFRLYPDSLRHCPED